MAVTPFKPLQTTDQDLNRVQANIKLFAEALVNNPLLRGHLIRDVYVNTLPTPVEHKLGRNITGWIVTDRDQTSKVQRVMYDTLPGTYLYLSGETPVTLDLWVF